MTSYDCQLKRKREVRRTEEEEEEEERDAFTLALKTNREQGDFSCEIWTRFNGELDSEK